MSLVGATPTTVAMPFLLEGITYGIFGGGIAFLTLWLIYRSAVIAMFDRLHTTLYQPPWLYSYGIIALLLLGILLGLVGSLVSVVKYLHSPRSRLTNA